MYSVSDSTHIYEIISLSNDLLNLSEEYFELEREKFRLEQALRQNEISEYASNFSQAIIQDKKQIHNLDTRLGNNYLVYFKGENLNSQKKLESELRKWNSKNKLLKDDNLEKEYTITKLTKEVTDYQEQIKKLKSELNLNNNYNSFDVKDRNTSPSIGIATNRNSNAINVNNTTTNNINMSNNLSYSKQKNSESNLFKKPDYIDYQNKNNSLVLE